MNDYVMGSDILGADVDGDIIGIEVPPSTARKAITVVTIAGAVLGVGYLLLREFARSMATR